jgi:hypothetical protein
MLEGTHARAVDAGYDLVQAKSKGEKCGVVVGDGSVVVHAHKDIVWSTENTTVRCTFLGSYHSPERFGQELVIILDCISVDGQSIETRSYRERFAFVKDLLARADEPRLRAVVNYRVSDAGALWDHLDPKLSCGLVYRQSSAPFNKDLLFSRKYVEVPGGLP